MPIVVLYAFKGTFSGNAEFDYDHPELGARHQCMLFLKQDSPDRGENQAKEICAEYGFQDIDFILYAPLKIESLETDLYSGFTEFYEEALEQGASFLYYPNET